MMNQSQITLCLAIYGAILSTIAIFWNIRRDIKDRAEIKVNVKLVNRFIMSDLQPEYICIELSNAGKRPITITEIYYAIGKQVNLAKLSKPQDLPKELGEGQFYSIDIMKEKIKDLSEVKFFVAKDARGTKYRSGKYPLRGMT